MTMQCTTIEQIPVDYKMHNEEPKSTFPEGIADTTMVDVILRVDGQLKLFSNQPAQLFGWMIEPHASSYGLNTKPCPIVAYKLV